MRPTNLLTSTLCLASVASAWPTWQPIEALRREIAPLVARQNAKTTYNLSYSSQQGNTATTDTSAPAVTGNTTATGTESNKTTKVTSSPSFDARLPAGGVTMITPNPMSGAKYYKIADYITFAWNYTSLSITPSAVDVLASCALNSQTYTIATNQSITGPTQALTWDTGEYQATATVQLLTETYTLIIYDAAKDVSSTPQAGYLGTYDQFTFGMYVPQPYTPMADFVCATCSAAMSSVERQTLGFMFGMVAVTVFSFTWFAGVAGLW